MKHSFLPIQPPSLPRFLHLTVLALSLMALLPGCSDDDDTPANPAGPNKITVPQAALSPEGVQYDEANQRFFVSSRTQGRIGTVTDDSVYTQFADDARLVSTIGLNLDASRQRLLVAVSDNGANTTRTTPTTRQKLAALAIYNSGWPKFKALDIRYAYYRQSTGLTASLISADLSFTMP